MFVAVFRRECFPEQLSIHSEIERPQGFPATPPATATSMPRRGAFVTAQPPAWTRHPEARSSREASLGVVPELRRGQRADATRPRSRCHRAAQAPETRGLCHPSPASLPGPYTRRRPQRRTVGATRLAARSPRLPSPGTCVYRSAVSFGDLRAHLLSSPDDPPLSGGPQRVSPSARPTVAAKFWQLREKLLQTSVRTPAFSLWANRRRGARPPGPSARVRWIQRPQTASRAGHRLHPAGGARGLSWPRVLAGGR